MRYLLGTVWHAAWFLCGASGFLGTAACGSSDSGTVRAQENTAQPEAGTKLPEASSEKSDARPDTSSEGDAANCARRAADYEKFRSAHSHCTQDSDCVVIGDCGPNLFDAVRTDAAEEASTLWSNMCPKAWDGPVYEAVCTAGTCALQQLADACCGCVPKPSTK